MGAELHPSRLQLDRAALGLTVGEQDQRHAEGCEQCSLHVDAMRRELPVPEWVRALPNEHRGPLWRARAFWVGGLVGGAVAVVAAAALMMVPPRTPLDEPSRNFSKSRGGEIAEVAEGGGGFCSATIKVRWECA